jgi:histidinol dehydrogenase
MTGNEPNIRRVDVRGGDPGELLEPLLKRLRPDGEVVSESGRQRTVEVFGEPLTPWQVVERICRDVRTGGLAALLDYTERLDQVRLDGRQLRVPAEEITAAHKTIDSRFLETIHRIRRNITAFQQAILHRDVVLKLPGGGALRQRYLPLRRVGLCIPGGAAAYPSTLLMTAVPAQTAGVEQLVVVAPPTPFGAYNRHLLATCHELGIGEVYRVGGAQAVAALAYGVEGLAPVDKIVGPGNLFVTLAKKYVFGEVDIDSLAGPSEVVVIADESARADRTAADMIAQAEHAPGSSILVTWHEPLLDATLAQLREQLVKLDRGDWARQSLEQFGALVLVRDAGQAVDVANRLASEHLHIATEDADALLPGIRNAGAIFLGHHAPVAMGDYAAGPSHVLPTGTTARFASGLSSNSFLRSASVLELAADDLEQMADDVIRMAHVEGLTAHAQSVALRLDREGGE